MFIVITRRCGYAEYSEALQIGAKKKLKNFLKISMVPSSYQVCVSECACAKRICNYCKTIAPFFTSFHSLMFVCAKRPAVWSITWKIRRALCEKGLKG